jgi:hypothetical protein
MSLDEISGTDVNGDGAPEAVFDGFSGGQECCYTYWIVSLGNKPKVVHEIHNQVPLRFRKRSDGGVEIRTGEGAFDLFLLPHGDSVIPEVTMRMEGSKLVDVSTQYEKEYDEKISGARSELSPESLEKFHRAVYTQKMFIDQAPTVKAVLTIVLNYLYSGRESEAWSALDAMWPPTDEQRVRTLILERRGRGLLAHP